MRRGVVVVGMALAVLAASCTTPDGSSPPEPEGVKVGPCDWAMWGHGPDRTFALPDECESDITAETVGDLREDWFFNTQDVVTATPAVVDQTIYVGDWSGRFYALDRTFGEERWHYDTEHHEQVYAGQIVASAAVAEVGSDRLVFFAAGKTLYALDAISGGFQWSHELNPEGGDIDTTEIESSPVVVERANGRPTVIFGYDVHNTPGLRAGVMALDAEDGDVVWNFDPDEGAEPTGCVDVWSSPSVDEDRGLVFAGTGNCNSSPEGWGTYTEALFALDLETGEPEWSYQPHEPNNDD